ncbi:molybdate ABC transporter substrate-binding protein [Thalassospira xianhensis]|uniref:Molybdenum ABC transporter substrate-binding protein n=1 Tax=Thalassospira xianhensis MCCC 1A02616 TaxID=1177929 RepID=A0A367U7F0_9PROT|nr:molybdate ABC transporter substrate-binding protein [Thalassospira xianhensis]RCK03860.1 molybdenum ABC transporter substrate-binding protein [Thalassospira xianhensis MCCC 1A02616]
MRHLIRTGLASLFLLAAATTARAQEITVFAAASLTDAMTQVAQSYATATGDTLQLSFASSSTLARQIAAGAPADLYISANQKWMTWLADQDLIAANSRHDLLANALVLIAPADSNLAPITINSQTDLTKLIGDEDRIAVGDPDHVPAGIYARQALENLGQWDAIEPRLARADNVRAALALVERGEAPLGIVYATDAAIATDVKIIATFPENSHPAITYPVAITTGQANPAAVKLLAWLLGDDAGTIFAEYGFNRPATSPKTQ